MPTATKKKKSMKKPVPRKGKASSTKTKKRVLAKATKKAVKKAMKVKAKAKTAKPKIKILGRVNHFYDHISVAIIDVLSPIKVGDTLRFRRGEVDRTEVVTSIQIDHEPVKSAKKGDVIGVKVREKTQPGTIVLPA